MPAGLRVWDAAGTLLVSPEYRLSRQLGTVNTGTTAGSVVVADFAQGTPYYYFIPRLAPVGTNNRLWPDVTIAGTTLSWTFPTVDADSTIWATDILYGVY